MGRSKQVLRTYFPNSCPSHAFLFLSHPLSPSLSLSLSLLLFPSLTLSLSIFLSEESWITTRGTWCCCTVLRTSDGLSRLEGMAWLLARYILLGTSFVRFQRRRTKNGRARRAATHNCVSTRSVCGQLDNVMNVDIFPNADITYDPPPSVSARALPPSLLSLHLVVPGR